MKREKTGINKELEKLKNMIHKYEVKYEEFRWQIYKKLYYHWREGLLKIEEEGHSISQAIELMNYAFSDRQKIHRKRRKTRLPIMTEVYNDLRSSKLDPKTKSIMNQMTIHHYEKMIDHFQFLLDGYSNDIWKLIVENKKEA